MSFMQEHLPALQVVLPLVAASLCALFRVGYLSWLITLSSSILSFLVAVFLLLRVLEQGIISYEIGGWSPPFGIEYRVDLINAFVLLIVSCVSAVIVPYTQKSISARFGSTEQSWFYCMYLLVLTGLLGVTITGDAFNIFVFLEISSLASYALIAMGRDRRGLTAAYQYLIMGTIGATFIVIGIGLLWAMTGTLNLYDLASRLPEIKSSRPVLAALAFLTVGVSLKLALFPLHLWLPNAYAYGPSVASAFLAGTATKVSIYLLLRFFFTIFGGATFFNETPLPEILKILALIAMFAASIVAIFQSNIKRMLAYSSVAQIGFIILGISYATETSLTGAMTHMFNHAIMKAGLFLLLGAIMFRLGSVKIEELSGIGRKMPLTMAGFVILGLSLIGAPGTAGFISKWYLGLGALEQGEWWILVLIVSASLLTMIYIGRVVEVAYFREPTDEVVQLKEAPLEMLWPAYLLIAAAIYFGFDTSFSADLARQAAVLLVNAVY